MQLKFPESVPDSEFSLEFVQGMADRMATSYFKYGLVADAYPQKVNALKSMQARVEKYLKTGNTEFLMDAANFLMIEYMRPSVEGAKYEPTDSKASPGRAWNGEVDRSQRGNKEL